MNGSSGLGGKALSLLVRDVGLSPIWFHFSLVNCTGVKRGNIYLQNNSNVSFRIICRASRSDKKYITNGNKLCIPRYIVPHLRSYIKDSHLCQLSRNKKLSVRQLQKCIN